MTGATDKATGSVRIFQIPVSTLPLYNSPHPTLGILSDLSIFRDAA